MLSAEMNKKYKRKQGDQKTEDERHEKGKSDNRNEAKGFVGRNKQNKLERGREKRPEKDRISRTKKVEEAERIH